jgi:DNA-binding FadR family transcriptional regulator
LAELRPNRGKGKEWNVSRSKEPVGDGIDRSDKSLRLHGSIARDLGIAIVTGKYPPGHVLTSEVDFAERNHISRTAYREAIRILAAKGLVESRPKAGTKITDPSRWHILDPDVLADLRGRTQPGGNRRPVRAAPDHRAGRRRDRRHAPHRGATGADGPCAGGNGQAHARFPLGQAADQAFHSTLLKATGNMALISLASTISAAVRWTTIYKQRKRKLPRDPLPDHRVLFDAVADGDGPAARAAMQTLIELALADIDAPARA